MLIDTGGVEEFSVAKFISSPPPAFPRQLQSRMVMLLSSGLSPWMEESGSCSGKFSAAVAGSCLAVRVGKTEDATSTTLTDSADRPTTERAEAKVTHDIDARCGLCTVSVSKGAPLHQHATGGYDAQALAVVSVNQTVSDLDVVCPENKDTIASRLSDMQLHNT